MKKLIMLFMVLMLFSVSLVSATWFNTSFENRQLIDCSNIPNNQSIIIDGSDGFSIDGNLQIVWTICRDELYLYWNDETDYFVADESGIVSMEVESGNGTSINPETIWSLRNYSAVYHFNQPSGNLLDSTSNNNDGVVVGSPNRNPEDCLIGGCYDFNETNSDYINVSDSISLDLPTHTIEAWVRMEDVTGYQGSGISIKGTALSMNWFYGVDTSLNMYSNNGAEQDTSGIALNNNQWEFITYVRNSTTVSFYTSGTLDFNNSHDINPVNNHEMLLGLATEPPSNHAFMDGKIDELRIVSGSRTDSEILSTYNNYQSVSGYGILGVAETVPEVPFSAFSIPIVSMLFTVFIILIGVGIIASLILLLVFDFKNINLNQKMLSIIGICILTVMLISFIPILFNILS